MKNNNIFIPEILIKPEKITILFDMDDVLNDCAGGIIKELKKEYNKEVTYESNISWNFKDTWGIECYDIINKKGFAKNLEPKNDALSIFPLFYRNKNIEVFIVSACSDSSIEERKIWLKKYFPDFPLEKFIACSIKNQIIGHYLIDDYYKNLIAFEKTGGNSIVFDMPHNKNLSYTRVSSLKEFYDMICIRHNI